MEQYTMVKAEAQPNEDIFVFYMDENGTPIESTDGVISTIDSEQLQQLRENYVIEELPSDTQYAEAVVDSETTDNDQSASAEEYAGKERWLDEETEKLLIFYMDNKQAFQNPAMKNKHLWTVACKTMLIGKTPTSCEMKMRNIKRKYCLLHLDFLKNNNNPKVWPFYDLCHQCFHDDGFLQKMMKENVDERKFATEVSGLSAVQPEQDGTIVLKKSSKSPDEKVSQMLQLYLRYKTDHSNEYLWHKKVWEQITLQLGEDAEFWHKRFLNFKQHYIRMLDKRKESGSNSINWPYMAIYDEIFKDDPDFIRKYGAPFSENVAVQEPPQPISIPNLNDWNNTEKTVLIKYYFDCLDEFQDPSIPDGFLWNEVGRLLDKKPEKCREKYVELRREHLELYCSGGYNYQQRTPIQILFDNIISRQVEKMFYEPSKYPSAAEMQWEVEKTDEMVQFLFDNIVLFKDPVCHFVCWAAVAEKLDENVHSCKEMWNDLTGLYKTILNDKKEDSDLQVDWRYIDIFDRIFDYGMDTKLLEGYEKKDQIQQKPKKIVQAKPTERASTDEPIPDDLSDLEPEPEEFDNKTSTKRSRGIEDPKQMKILEYYLKYKDKFTSTRKKNALWENLASTIGLTAEQCAHRFRNLKQVYMAYIQREIDKPDKPILWPYFALCKKVFGYRLLKNKLKQGKMDLNEQEEWTPRDIKMLINYFGQHYADISQDLQDVSKWKTAAKIIMNKSEMACRDKFLELNNSYRKILVMMNRNPESKINWKYFKFFHEIYSRAEGMEVDPPADGATNTAIKTELQDDDLHCIIVIPEGEQANQATTQIIINPQNTTKTQTQEQETRYAWQNAEKMALLKAYLDYIEANKDKTINTLDMWKEIASKINKGPRGCSKVFGSIKSKYEALKSEGKVEVIKKSTLYSLMQKILTDQAKVKIVYTPIKHNDYYALTEQTTYKDVEIPLWKVKKALEYYLEHVEQFISPKYDKKYAWYNLIKAAEYKSIKKMFLKINYLKQFYNSETNEVDGKPFEFAHLIKEILEKEFTCKVAMGNIPEPMNIEDDPITVWTDDETEQLLAWYLNNLDKFKNPLYVPSYLWAEASNVLNKSAVACSTKMTEIRSQYSAMVKENAEELTSWRFYELCQKIYGTGKKNIEQEEQYDTPDDMSE
ncbi:hypothetical protein NE865_07978 [Phthorimaea operculella]|nr:hypothetical protein NE865_07978 [Phthorimaea operculella]